MTDRDDGEIRNAKIDRNAADVLELARARFLRKFRAGIAMAQDWRGLFDQLRRFAGVVGWYRPETREQMARGLYRGPGFVVLDALGYDRALAKASVGPGWAAMVDEMFDVRDRDHPGVRIVQVKEKFAGLRVYVEGSDDATGEAVSRFDDYLDDLEWRSQRICEECGASGVVRAGSWLKTRCDAHSEGRPPLADPIERGPGRPEREDA